MKHTVFTAVMAGTVALATLIVPGTTRAEGRMISDYYWADVERVVAIGDLHGDYGQYMKVMALAGLVDSRGRWAGGATHLVQTGDIPDRGPDTRQIIDHLVELQEQAPRDGGRVHLLIGNHEAMNVYGDLRYVTAGEYEAFRTRSSKRYQDMQFEHHVETMAARDPASVEDLDLKAFRKEWEKEYPLGWVEHRQAWSAEGEYGQRILNAPVVLRVNDTLFLHGGLSAKYCQLELPDYSREVHDQLANFAFDEPGIATDEYGPLWYRGLATDGESVRGPMVDAILARYGVNRIVVGHTPTQGIVWPRFDGKVVLNDIGIAAHYGGHMAYLELRGDTATANYAGGTLPLPTDNDSRLEYLEAVVRLDPANAYLRSRLQKMQTAAANGSPDPAAGADNAGVAAALAADPEAAQREAWLSPDNCR